MLSASCHCGTVQLEIDRKPQQLTDCNCSICRRYAALWAYYTRKSVRVACTSPDALAVYSWGNRTVEFHYCAKCGCVMFHERTKKAGDATRMGVNARMIDPAALAGVRIRKVDGALTWKYLD